MNTTRYNRFCRFYFQRPSLCSPLSSSPTSSVQPPAHPAHMAPATPALSAHPREDHLMETVLLDLESAVSSPPQPVVQASPQIQPTSEIPTIQVPTQPPVLEPVPILSRRSLMTFANWGWISRPWLGSTLAPVELVVWMTLQFLVQLDMTLQPFVEQTQDTTVGFCRTRTIYCIVTSLIVQCMLSLEQPPLTLSP